MMSKKLLFGLLIVTTFPGVALGQSNIRMGSNIRGPQPSQTLKIDEARRVQSKFGDCIVKLHRQAAEDYVLDSSPDDRSIRKISDKVADGNCLLSAMNPYEGAIMRLPADTLRYTIADALTRAHLPATPLSDLDRVPRLALIEINKADFQPKTDRPGKARLKQLQDAHNARLAANFLAAYAECIVRTDPSGSRSLLSSPVVSGEENMGFRKLQPVLASCFPTGRTMSLDKGTVRGAIAYAHYRLARASRSIASTTAAGSQD